MKKNKSNNDSSQFFDILNAIKVRLDTIVLIMIKSQYSDEKGKLSISEVAPFLHSVGYSPIEIAKIFGKKKASDVSQYLYSQKRISK